VAASSTRPGRNIVRPRRPIPGRTVRTARRPKCAPRKRWPRHPVGAGAASLRSEHVSKSRRCGLSAVTGRPERTALRRFETQSQSVPVAVTRDSRGRSATRADTARPEDSGVATPLDRARAGREDVQNETAGGRWRRLRCQYWVSCPVTRATIPRSDPVACPICGRPLKSTSDHWLPALECERCGRFSDFGGESLRSEQRHRSAQLSLPYDSDPAQSTDEDTRADCAPDRAR